MFLVALAVIILAAKVSGDLASRWGQPPVLGQLVAGLVLGFVAQLLPERGMGPGGETQLTHLADLGVLLLMFVAGLETDWLQLRSVGRPAFSAAVAGVLVPLVVGWAVGRAFQLPGSEALFLGVILTATSVSISAQTLLELGYLQTVEGATILGAAVIDDVIGLLVFAVAVAVAGNEGGQMPIPVLLLSLVAFFVIGPTLGSKLSHGLLRLAHSMRGAEVPLGIAVAIALLFAAVAAEIGIAGITGAYLAGLLINREDLYGDLTEKVKVLAFGVFVPIFLVKTGMEAHVDSIGPVLGLVIVVSVVAVLTKVIGCGIGARICGLTNYQSVVVGIGMISRGEVALIVGTLALQEKLISPLLFSATVIIVLVTTLITPILLRIILARAPESQPTGWVGDSAQAREG